MASLIEAIDLKRKMFFEYERAPYHCLEVDISKPTARGGQTLVRVKMRNLLTRAVFDRTFKAGEKFSEPDLARIDAQGRIHCLGRADDQVKIRGYRIELEEIEAHLVRCDGVRAAACRVSRPDRRQDLVAYIVPVDPARPPDAGRLRATLADVLPAVAVLLAYGTICLAGGACFHRFDAA